MAMIPTYKWRPDVASERGAVIVHVAIALLGLMAMSTFVIDYGVMWAARRQAQNAADAGALAGAISMAFVDFNNLAMARQSALDVARLNGVFGEVPDITAADVTFPECPPGSPGAGTDSCIRVDVFRNQRAGGNPLPTFFAKLVGIDQQGVRATATAEALFGNSTDCVKPFAIPDKWQELRNNQGPLGWDESDSFERYDQPSGAVLDPADVYVPGPNGTGYSPDSVTLGGGDYGREITLKAGRPNEAIAPGWFFPIRLGESTGGDDYRYNIANCNTTVIGPGSIVQNEPGNMIGPTKQGMNDLINLDPEADWDPSLNGGRGGISGGCMGSGDCRRSPRLVAIPVFDPDNYDAGRASGLNELVITKVLGFFIDRIRGNEVVGYITTYPANPNAGMGGVPGEDFIVSVTLVR